MPTYEWSCEQGHGWDVVTTVAERDLPSICPKCQAQGVRGITLPSIDRTAASDWNTASYNPGLGCYTKSYKHGRQIAKARGLEEVGTEKPENIHKAAEKRRVEIREERWAEADRIKQFD